VALIQFAGNTLEDIQVFSGKFRILDLEDECSIQWLNLGVFLHDVEFPGIWRHAGRSTTPSAHFDSSPGSIACIICAHGVDVRKSSHRDEQETIPKALRGLHLRWAGEADSVCLFFLHGFRVAVFGFQKGRGRAMFHVLSRFLDRLGASPSCWLKDLCPFADRRIVPR